MADPAEGTGADADQGGPAAAAARVALALALHALAVLLLVRLVLLAPALGYDDFWHLLVGSIIVETGEVPRADAICFTTEGHAWINLNWLAQVGVWGLYRWAGFAGPLAAAACLLVATLVFIALQLRDRRAGPLASLLAVGGVGFAVLLAFGTRPRVASFALLALVSWLLARPDPARRLPASTAAGLLAALLLWNNLHGGFVYGYGLIGAATVGGAADAWRRGERPLARRELGLAAVVLLALLGFALHPHGFGALAYAVLYPLQFDAAFFAQVNELRPFDFRGPLGPALELYLLVAAVALVLAPRGPRWRDLLPALLFLHLTLTVRRGVTPLVIVTAPFVAQQASAALRALAAAGQSDARARLGRALEGAGRALEPGVRTLPVTLGLVALLWAVGVAPGRTPSTARGALDSPAIDRERHPVAIAQHLAEAPGSGRVFNAFHTGGLLGWALYPQRRILIDGRGDLHSQGDVLDVYLQVTGLRAGWKERLDATGADLVVMPEDAPLIHALEVGSGWRRVVAADGHVLLERPAAGGE